MDLNNIPKSALRPPLRVVRITQPVKDVEVVPEGLDLPDLPVFDGGEQLPEEERLPDPEPQVDLQTWLEDEITEDTPLPWKTEIVDKGFTNEPPEGEQPWYVERLKSRDCPVCPAVISIIDEGEDLLGLGMSLEAAQKLEAEYAEHLEEHPRSDFLKRIHELQEQTVLAPRPAMQAAVTYPDEVVPGPARRSPEKQAAVDALDRRLGRAPAAPASPEDTAARDEALRAARAARRAAPPPEPYQLTPRWSQDIGDGVVGIKR